MPVLRSFFLVYSNLLLILYACLDAYEVAAILLAFNFLKNCGVLSIILDLSLFRFLYSSIL
jgi:hypothetical protein